MPSSIRLGGFRGGNDLTGNTSGVLREFKIANGLATNLCPGDPVTLHTDGTIVKTSVSTQPVLGVMVGLVPEGQGKYFTDRYFASGTSVTNSTNTYSALVDVNTMSVLNASLTGLLHKAILGQTSTYLPEQVILH